MTMRKLISAVIAVSVLALLAFCIHTWNRYEFRNSKLEILCEASAHGALEHFEEYNANGNDGDYIAGVAEFRTYMRAYLLLTGQSNTNYTWCDILYGDMIQNPDSVKAHMSELVEALEYLVEDYNHSQGFHLINVLNNQLRE